MSAGKDHCRITHNGTHFKCNHCDTYGGPYKNASICQRMASNHVVKKHPDIAKPASQQVSEPKRPHMSRKQKSGVIVRFCPVCGTNMHAISVAIGL